MRFHDITAVEILERSLINFNKNVVNKNIGVDNKP